MDEIASLINRARDLGYDHFFLDSADALGWEVILNPDGGPNAKPRAAGAGTTLDNAFKAAIAMAETLV